MSSRPTPAFTWLVVGISLLFVTVVSFLDAGCFFELWYPLRLVAAGYYLLAVFAFVRGRSTRAIVGTSLVWTLVILPQVRWNHSKSFYVDARGLDVGMTAAECRKRMAPHLELGVDYHPTLEEQEWLPSPPDPAEGMIFLHCPLGWTDHCEVRLDAGGRVREIHIEKD